MDINKLVESFLGSGASNTPSTGQQAGQQAGRQAGQPVGQQMSQQIGGALKSFPGGLAGGAAAGGLVALMLGSKKARKVGGTVLTYGGMAVVGGLAFKAWQNYKANQSNRPADMHDIPAPPSDSGFDPANSRDAQGNDMRLALIQAMISAAKADQHIDAVENSRIREQIDAAALGTDEKSFLFDQLGQDSDPIAIARLAQDEPQAAELYLASASAIDIDTPEESRYMERLGDALRLPGPLIKQLQDHAVAARDAGMS